MVIGAIGSFQSMFGMWSSSWKAYLTSHAITHMRDLLWKSILDLSSYAKYHLVQVMYNVHDTAPYLIRADQYKLVSDQTYFV